MTKHALTCLLFLSLFCAAFASDIMAGSWQSTTGSIIRIPAGSDNFDLVVTHKDGEKFLLSARWIEVGYQFQFVNEYGNLVRATLYPDNPNQVHVETVKTGKVNYWQRIR
jgi:hypothetical protein